MSALRAWAWARQTSAIPSNFSFYDHMLDAAVTFGAIPTRFADLRGDDGSVDLAAYSTIARGEGDKAPLEMTKWFDSNYHYLVPEIGPETVFALSSTALGGRVRGGQERGLRHPARHHRPADVPVPGQGIRRRSGRVRPDQPP